MNGIEIRHLTKCFSDKQETIWEVFNGFRIANCKILRLKKAKEFPRHYHNYVEISYLESGKIWYSFKSLIDSHLMEHTMTAGEIIIKAPFIEHKPIVLEDSVLWCFSECPFVSSEFNNLTT